jgi:hypothetical protein
LNLSTSFLRLPCLLRLFNKVSIFFTLGLEMGEAIGFEERYLRHFFWCLERFRAAE